MMYSECAYAENRTCKTQPKFGELFHTFHIQTCLLPLFAIKFIESLLFKFLLFFFSFLKKEWYCDVFHARN